MDMHILVTRKEASRLDDPDTLHFYPNVVYPLSSYTAPIHNEYALSEPNL